MDYQEHKYRLFFHFAATILILSGCAPKIRKPMQVCPGKESAAEAISILRARSQNTAPLRANGQCLLEYYVEGKKHKENFPVKLWLNPPAQIYLQGNVAFNARGVVMGSNEREFWLSIRPKEISSYWWGRWSKGSRPDEKLMISPETVLEALGIAAVGGDENNKENWSLFNEGAFDVLTKRDDEGRTIKKIYIYSCDYLVRRIEYFDENSKAVIVTELDKYKQVLKNFFVPTIVKITKGSGRARDSVRLTLRPKTIKSVNFTEKQLERLYTRPEPRGFKHIYKIVDGDVIEQPQ